MALYIKGQGGLSYLLGVKIKDLQGRQNMGARVGWGGSTGLS